jgi:hypothetical protein
MAQEKWGEEVPLETRQVPQTKTINGERYYVWGAPGTFAKFKSLKYARNFEKIIKYGFGGNKRQKTYLMEMPGKKGSYVIYRRNG